MSYIQAAYLGQAIEIAKHVRSSSAMVDPHLLATPTDHL